MKRSLLTLLLLCGALAEKAAACGICGSFTTMRPLWEMTLFSVLVYAALAIAQVVLLGANIGYRVAVVVLVFLVYPGLSVDLAWVILLFACLTETALHARAAFSKGTTRSWARIAFALLFLFFPAVVAYNYIVALKKEGIVFYPKYAEATVRAKAARVKGAFNALVIELETHRKEHDLYPLTTGSGALFRKYPIPTDAFSLKKLPCGYVASASGDEALIISRGPDVEFQINLESVPWDELGVAEDRFRYDPTNGTVSIGDVFVFLRKQGKKGDQERNKGFR